MQFREYFDKREDPSGRTYYWLTGEIINTDGGPDVDHSCLEDGYVSVTPIHYNLTDEELFEKLKDWSFEK